MIGYVGIGSNLGDRRAWLRTGIDGLRGAGLEPLALSSVWETEPVGTTASPWYLNMVVALRSGRPPLELLDLLLDIERRAGRVRDAANAPRTLDLDLLMLGSLRWQTARLELPHPHLWKRRFVLEPLCEIAPDTRNPASGRTVAEECARLGSRPIVRRIGPLGVADIITPSIQTGRSVSTDEVQIDRR